MSGCGRTFDSTMESLTEGRKPWVTKLSSAGLIYLHFGRQVIANIAGKVWSAGFFGGVKMTLMFIVVSIFFCV